jgi:metallo-beta-lactamase family protein
MASAPIQLTFLGAAGEVTGSSYLVESGRVKFLVDCGMFQGGREADEKNRNALNFDVKTLDFVLLTHAHIDHCGLLPRLTAFGYDGPIYASKSTAALAKIMLEDSARIQEKDAIEDIRRARKFGEKATEIAPLYTVEQARECWGNIEGIPWEQAFSPHEDLTITLRNTGHILGSASFDVEIRADGVTKRVVFSGDVGSPGRPPCARSRAAARCGCVAD